MTRSSLPHECPLHPEPTPLAAMRAFRALAAPHRLRVTRDAEGWPLIPGRLGQIEWHDDTDLACYTGRPRLFGRLWAAGVRSWQIGSTEARGLLPLEALPAVAAVIGARKRRRANAGSFQTPGSA